MKISPISNQNQSFGIQFSKKEKKKSDTKQMSKQQFLLHTAEEYVYLQQLH